LYGWMVAHRTQITTAATHVLIIGAVMAAIGTAWILAHRIGLAADRVDELVADDPEPDPLPAPDPAYSAEFDVRLNQLSAFCPETVYPAGCPA
jgi:hypothetical protein